MPQIDSQSLNKRPEFALDVQRGVARQVFGIEIASGHKWIQYQKAVHKGKPYPLQAMVQESHRASGIVQKGGEKTRDHKEDRHVKKAREKNDPPRKRTPHLVLIQYAVRVKGEIDNRGMEDQYQQHCDGSQGINRMITRELYLRFRAGHFTPPLTTRSSARHFELK